MPRRLIDLSMALENDVKSDPAGYEPHIEYVTHADTFDQLAAFFPGLQPTDLPDREATLYLLERGVRLTGTDGWSWDAPFSHTGRQYLETGDASLIWEGHKAGRTIGYCHLEKLRNLEALPATGFMVSCFPVKIKGASAGWTRAVAILDEPAK